MGLLEVDPDLARPGWVPLVILIVMAVVLFFLFRSMRRMIKTLDPEMPSKNELDADGRPRPAEEVFGRPRAAEDPREPAAHGPASDRTASPGSPPAH